MCSDLIMSQWRLTLGKVKSNILRSILTELGKVLKAISKHACKIAWLKQENKTENGKIMKEPKSLWEYTLYKNEKMAKAESKKH